ncbi:phage late control D family protein [Paractinoplanes durhamensis]|uniref:phage late control D family protein n=1 Tax=Paractinoplanes durhamensis TaxID=113563 RepID=UPI0036459C0C
MAHASLVLTIGGAEIDEVYAGLLALEVELDDDLAGMFRLSLALRLRSDGTWTLLDDDVFTPWTTVVVRAGVDDAPTELISGYVTHVRPEFGAVPEQCRLEVLGTDTSVLLDRVEVLKAWPAHKDSDIAGQILKDAGFEAKVTGTDVVHDDKVATIMQRETDLEFLRRLARRNGFECFVDGNVGWFRPPAVAESPQPLLAAQFGAETNVNRLVVELDALAPAEVHAYGIDRITKEPIAAAARPGCSPPSARPAARR